MSEGGKVIIIKKKAKGHGHHGGAWKVAYADFVTAMMALFIVLWLLTQTDSSSKEAIAEYFRTGTLPGGSLTIGRAAGSNPPKAIEVFPPGASGTLSPRAVRGLKGAIQSMLKKSAKDAQVAKIAANATIKISAEGALIELVDNEEDLLFAVSSSELKPAVVRFLQQLAPSLEATGANLVIHGHTDGRGYKESKKTNWDLSFERAERARRVLEGAGVKHGNITGVLAHADTEPYVKDDPLAPQNRRLAIMVTRGSAQLPSLEPGPTDDAADGQPRGSDASGAPDKPAAPDDKVWRPNADAAPEDPAVEAAEPSSADEGAGSSARDELKREAERQRREAEQYLEKQRRKAR